MTSQLRQLLLIPVLVGITACSTSKIPDVDDTELPGFKEAAENVGDYPKASQAPQVPTDLPSDEQWDKAAAAIIKSRDKFNAPPAAKDEYKSEAQILRDMEELKAKVEEYKIDDPVE